MSRPKFLSLLFALTLTGCDIGLRYRVVQPEPHLFLEPRQASFSLQYLEATASALGPGERIATARSPIGNIQRVVNPYGEDQFLFNIEVANRGERPVLLKAAEARLEASGRRIPAKTLEDYKKAWPTYPIADAEMARDQAAAFTFVLRSMLLERLVLAGEGVKGRLAFPSPAGAKGDLILTLPVETTGTLRFVFKVSPAPQRRTK